MPGRHRRSGVTRRALSRRGGSGEIVRKPVAAAGAGCSRRSTVAWSPDERVSPDPRAGGRRDRLEGRSVGGAVDRCLHRGDRRGRCRLRARAVRWRQLPDPGGGVERSPLRRSGGGVEPDPRSRGSRDTVRGPGLRGHRGGARGSWRPGDRADRLRPSVGLDDRRAGPGRPVRRGLDEAPPRDGSELRPAKISDAFVPQGTDAERPPARPWRPRLLLPTPREQVARAVRPARPSGERDRGGGRTPRPRALDPRLGGPA